MLSTYLDFAIISYENPDLGYKSLKNKCNECYFYDASEFTSYDAQFYTICRDDELIFAIRGSSSIDDFWTDAKITQVDAIEVVYTSNGEKIHYGFLKQFKSIQDQILNTVKLNPQKRVTFVGHSLGGALATLCAVSTKLIFLNKYITCVTFGSPRVGNLKFVELFNKIIDKSYRCVNNYDAVTMRPYWGYEHVGNLIKLGNKPKPWFLYFGYVEDHYLTNYKLSIEN